MSLLVSVFRERGFKTTLINVGGFEVSGKKEKAEEIREKLVKSGRLYDRNFTKGTGIIKAHGQVLANPKATDVIYHYNYVTMLEQRGIYIVDTGDKAFFLVSLGIHVLGSILCSCYSVD